MVAVEPSREVADHPGLVGVCTDCGDRVGLRRHIKTIGGDRYYAICYACSEASR